MGANYSFQALILSILGLIFIQSAIYIFCHTCSASVSCWVSRVAMLRKVAISVSESVMESEMKLLRSTPTFTAARRLSAPTAEVGFKSFDRKWNLIPSTTLLTPSILHHLV